jgi:hypothetical protein
MAELHKCVIRKDLEGTALIPIWQLGKETKYINPTEPIEYRWIANNFMVMWENEWYSAYSIDFDFLD